MDCRNRKKTIVYMPIRNPLNLFRGSNLTLAIETLWMFGTAEQNFACNFKSHVNPIPCNGFPARSAVGVQWAFSAPTVGHCIVIQWVYSVHYNALFAHCTLTGVIRGSLPLKVLG